MVHEMLYVIEMLMEFLLTYVGINLIKKYVFLEHELEKGKQKRYHLLSAVFVVVTCLFLKDDAVYVLLFMVAMNIVWTGWQLLHRSAAGLMDVSIPEEDR